MDGYRLIDGPPAPEDYLDLRLNAGLSPKSEDQAKAALPGSWAACHVLHEAQDRVVAMGRVIGDGGWYFHVVDMAVLPDHERRGLGSAVLSHLLEDPRKGTAGCLRQPADPPGRRLYARHGFVESAPGSVGMALLMA